MRINSISNKNKLLLKDDSIQAFYLKQWEYFDIPNPISFIDFFTLGNKDGIYLWKYKKELGRYIPTNMLRDSSMYGRGGMNNKGIYIIGGKDKVSIYDMKYFTHFNQKIELLGSFSVSTFVWECLFKDPESAICCDHDGYIMEYDLSNLHSLTPPTVFNKTTALSGLFSCMLTKDKKHIIAGADKRFYILDANGSLKNSQEYENAYPRQIAEVRENIVVTVDASTASVHDLRDIENIPPPFILEDIGQQFSVIGLENNIGDFAIGGNTSSGEGFVQILYMGEDIHNITVLKSISHYKECGIWAMKELTKGTIFYGGYTECTFMCLWNYAISPTQESLCYRIDYYIWDILPVPYYII